MSWPQTGAPPEAERRRAVGLDPGNVSDDHIESEYEHESCSAHPKPVIETGAPAEGDARKKLLSKYRLFSLARRV